MPNYIYNNLHFHNITMLKQLAKADGNIEDTRASVDESDTCYLVNKTARQFLLTLFNMAVTCTLQMLFLVLCLLL